MQRRLAAILAADVVGYSRLMGADEVGTLEALRRHRAELIDPAIAAHGGHIVKTMGDGLLVEFPSVVEAVACAVEVQRGMAERAAGEPEDRRIRLRMGINLGDVIIEEGDIYGDGVNVAARLEALAEPGGICVSRAVRHEVRDRLPLAFADMGEVAVKNIARPLRVYRVLRDEEAAPPPAAGPPPAAAAPARRGVPWRTALAALAALALLAVLGGIGWRYLAVPAPEETAAGRAAPALPDRPSLVVLPFANLGGDPEQDYFADGLTDDLITDLSGLSGLLVIAPSTAFAFKNRAAEPTEIARELGVRHVLEGSVRRLGDRVRINVQLIDGGTGAHVWGRRFDGPLSGIFALQDDVLGEIVGELEVELTESEEAQLARIPTANLEAYDEYLRAEREGYAVADADRLRRTLAFYDRAIELDPEFADAHAGYARALVEVIRLDYAEVIAGAVARKGAYEAASRALALDPDNARAHAVLALLQMVDGRHRDAIESARRAVALAPGSAAVHADLALVLAYAGRHGEAVAAVETALRLDPQPRPGTRLVAGIVFFFDRRHERAIAELEKAHAALSTSETPLEFLAAANAHAGHLDEARRHAEALLAEFPVVNLEYHRLRHRALARPEDLAHLIDGLARAGLPAWPYGFEAPAEDRLPGPEIARLALGRTWTGAHRNGAPFVQQIAPDGAFAYASAASFQTGRLWVDGDLLCQRIEGVLFGLPQCGPIYRNRDAEHAGDYVFVAPDSLKYFSQK